ncbi:testicular acid phosphatase homolog [Sitophilus oryzae]|uniref:Testicular acid phosphatase homolog n=1 Tax=Sitophilus oryzae TaxID=7048 RepID=A0A6J2X5N3_SITOR|nr:testicular acid phosphatase homolog [Sitophilus oryzae]
MILHKLLLSIYLLSLVQGKEILKQIHIVFRHGERSPTSTYPNDPHKNYTWPGVGYLTNRGKLQMYTLGQNLRTIYSEFVPKYYWPLDVNFTSSYSDRCLMSGQLVASGLFPPKDVEIWNPSLLWQPIPMHYLPRNIDNLIVMRTSCAKYDQEFIDVHSSAKVEQYNKEYSNLYKYLTEHTGMEINNIEAVESLYNTLDIQQLNNLTLPDWVNSSLLAEMKIIGAQNLAIYSETEYMKKMKGGFFLTTVLSLMKRSLNGSLVPSINLYSAHDLTLVHIMRALNLVDILKPDFGATLIIELYENASLKIFYLTDWNGTPQEQVLKECNNPCTIEKFSEAFKAVLPTNWTEECQYT